MKNISFAKISCKLTCQNFLIKSLIFFTLASTLWGCSRTITPSAIPTDTPQQPSPTTTEEGLLPDTHLAKETVQKVFELAGDYLIVAGNNESIEIACTVIEGSFCWFTEEDLGGELYGTITKDLSIMIIGEIKVEIVEQAKQNTLQLRCTRLIDSDGPITCEGNWGWTKDWNPIEVR